MNQQVKPESFHVPDVLLSAEAVGQLLMALNNASIYVKASDGSMRPFVDPHPINQILQAAIQLALRPKGDET